MGGRLLLLAGSNREPNGFLPVHAVSESGCTPTGGWTSYLATLRDGSPRRKESVADEILAGDLRRAAPPGRGCRSLPHHWFAEVMIVTPSNSNSASRKRTWKVRVASNFPSPRVRLMVPALVSLRNRSISLPSGRLTFLTSHF